MLPEFPDEYRHLMRMRTHDIEPNAVMEQSVELIEMASIVQAAYQEGRMDARREKHKRAQEDKRKAEDRKLHEEARKRYGI